MTDIKPYLDLAVVGFTIGVVAETAKAIFGKSKSTLGKPFGKFKDSKMGYFKN
jgi:hypothetical protein